MLCLWGRTAVEFLWQSGENTWVLSLCFSAWNIFFESTKQLLHQASSSANNIIAQLHTFDEQVLVKGLVFFAFVSFSTSCGILMFYLVQTACSIGEEVIIISQLWATLKHWALYYSICCALDFFDEWLSNNKHFMYFAVVVCATQLVPLWNKNRAFR